MSIPIPAVLLSFLTAASLSVTAAEPATVSVALHHAAAATNRLVITPALLAGLEAELRTNHPALRAADARAQAARLDAAGTRRWADPTVRLGGSVFDERNMFSREEGNLAYGVEQKLPLLGKEQAARAQANAVAIVAAARATTRFELLRRDLTKAVFAAALAEETVQLGVEDLTWLETTVATTEARYRSGTSSQFELLRVQNERAKRATLLVNDERRRDAARALVNHSLGREPLTPQPAFTLPSVADDVRFTPSLVALAMRNAPDLRVLERERAVAAAAVEVTRRSQRPDVALGVEGRQFAGDGGFRSGALTVSLSLPWLNQANYRRDLARDRERLHAAEEDQIDSTISLSNEVHHLTVEAEAARREALLYRDDVLPRSEHALAAAHAGWSGGRGLMNDVLEARRMLVEAKLMLARATAEQGSLLSDLAYVCGVPDAATLNTVSAALPSEAQPHIH
jgi:outer membrane protein TolC